MLEVASFQLLASWSSPRDLWLSDALSQTMFIRRPMFSPKGEVSTACPVALPLMSITPPSIWLSIARSNFSIPRVRVSAPLFDMPPSMVTDWSRALARRLPIFTSPLL